MKHDEIVLKYAPHAYIEDYLKLGWLPSGIDGGLFGTPHGRYSIIVEFLCCCGRPEKMPHAG
jgi:hypothetical protein